LKVTSDSVASMARVAFLFGKASGAVQTSDQHCCTDLGLGGDWVCHRGGAEEIACGFLDVVMFCNLMPSASTANRQFFDIAFVR